MIWKDYDLNEVLNRNAVDYHVMTGEHTEILGQFLDWTGMNPEILKECLNFLLLYYINFDWIKENEN